MTNQIEATFEELTEEINDELPTAEEAEMFGPFQQATDQEVREAVEAMEEGQ